MGQCHWFRPGRSAIKGHSGITFARESASQFRIRKKYGTCREVLAAYSSEVMERAHYSRLEIASSGPPGGQGNTRLIFGEDDRFCRPVWSRGLWSPAVGGQGSGGVRLPCLSAFQRMRRPSQGEGPRISRRCGLNPPAGRMKGKSSTAGRPSSGIAAASSPLEGNEERPARQYIGARAASTVVLAARAPAPRQRA
jgi:hypothetical protein